MSNDGLNQFFDDLPPESPSNGTTRTVAEFLAGTGLLAMAGVAIALVFLLTVGIAVWLFLAMVIGNRTFF
jgi:hypothetical protein